MLPTTLALVDDDKEFSEYLSQFLRQRGVRVDAFGDSNDLLAHADPFHYEFYVVDLMLPGVDGVDLIKVLRRRTNAGLLVVSGRLGPDVFGEVVSAGADMYLAKPVRFEQVAVALEAVQRRAGGQSAPALDWTLDRAARQLVAPDGARVDLSAIDLALLECFVAAGGEVVTRDTLRRRIGRPDDTTDGADNLSATIYRLRRRIERATPSLVPLHAKSRVGYVFRAPLAAR